MCIIIVLIHGNNKYTTDNSFSWKRYSGRLGLGRLASIMLIL